MSIFSRSGAALAAPVFPSIVSPAAYSVSSLYPLGFNTVIAQPAFSTYNAQFLAPLSPVDPAENTVEAKEAPKDEQSKE